jgi:hypothetical protein
MYHFESFKQKKRFHSPLTPASPLTSDLGETLAARHHHLPRLPLASPSTERRTAGARGRDDGSGGPFPFPKHFSPATGGILTSVWRQIRGLDGWIKVVRRQI